MSRALSGVAERLPVPRGSESASATLPMQSLGRYKVKCVGYPARKKIRWTTFGPELRCASLLKPGWRNWQTRWTQNPVDNIRVGSTPTPGTKPRGGFWSLIWPAEVASVAAVCERRKVPKILSALSTVIDRRYRMALRPGTMSIVIQRAKLFFASSVGNRTGPLEPKRILG
jgi:hypothetical protein